MQQRLCFTTVLANQSIHDTQRHSVSQRAHIPQSLIFLLILFRKPNVLHLRLQTDDFRDRHFHQLGFSLKARHVIASAESQVHQITRNLNGIMIHQRHNLNNSGDVTCQQLGNIRPPSSRLQSLIIAKLKISPNQLSGQRGFIINIWVITDIASAGQSHTEFTR